MKDVIFLTLLLSTGLHAAVYNIRTADGNGADTLLGNDSVYNSSMIFGSSTSVEVRYSEPVRMRMALLRFDLSTITIAPGETIENVTLGLAQIFGSNRSRNWLVYGLADGLFEEYWDETTTSYDTAPGVNGPGAEDGTYSIDTTNYWTMEAIQPSWGVAGIGGGMAFMPTIDLKSFVETDTNGVISLLLVIPTSDISHSYGIASKEYNFGTLAPTLQITTIPEPSAALLGSLGLLGLLRRKRA